MGCKALYRLTSYDLNWLGSLICNIYLFFLAMEGGETEMAQKATQPCWLKHGKRSRLALFSQLLSHEKSSHQLVINL